MHVEGIGFSSIRALLWISLCAYTESGTSPVTGRGTAARPYLESEFLSNSQSSPLSYAKNASGVFIVD